MSDRLPTNAATAAAASEAAVAAVMRDNTLTSQERQAKIQHILAHAEPEQPEVEPTKPESKPKTREKEEKQKETTKEMLIKQAILSNPPRFFVDGDLNKSLQPAHGSVEGTTFNIIDPNAHFYVCGLCGRPMKNLESVGRGHQGGQCLTKNPNAFRSNFASVWNKMKKCSNCSATVDLYMDPEAAKETFYCRTCWLAYNGRETEIQKLVELQNEWRQMHIERRECKSLIEHTRKYQRLEKTDGVEASETIRSNEDKVVQLERQINVSQNQLEDLRHSLTGERTVSTNNDPPWFGTHTPPPLDKEETEEEEE